MKKRFLEVNHLNNNNFRFDQGILQTDSQSAKLAVIAGAISTLGDGLATVAAILAIEEARQEQSVSGDSKNMQKQIDYLSSEMEELKKQMKRFTSPRR